MIMALCKKNKFQVDSSQVFYHNTPLQNWKLPYHLYESPSLTQAHINATLLNSYNKE